VFITHSISEALEIGDRIVVLKRPAMIAYDVSQTNDHVRPCNLKPQQRDLTPVLCRPVENALIN